MDSKSVNLKSLLCIDYPALVENEKEAIRTLGGMDRLNQAFSRRNSKLLLNFTPDNIFAKMLCSNQINEANEEMTNIDSHNTPGYSNMTSNDAKADDDNRNDHFHHSTSNNNKQQNEFISIPGLLLSVRKNKNSKFDTKIIGKIKKVYSFNKIADFQYLPMSSSSIKIPPYKPSNVHDHSQQDYEQLKNMSQFTYNAFYDNFLFKNIQDYEYELRKNNLPQLFILPPFFSRFDDPVNYAFKSEPTKKAANTIETNDQSTKTTPKSQHEKGDDSMSEYKANSSKYSNNDDSLNTSNLNVSSNNDTSFVKNKSTDDLNNTDLIRSVRQERASQAFLVSFKCESIPTKPSDKLKMPRSELAIECISKLKSLFQERPCYLKSVLLCITNYSPMFLKECLPHVAYYFTTGPWRSCWVRYGYDPRKDPSAKIYQMIDYRLRNIAEPDKKIRAKPRASYHKRKFRSDLAENDLEDYKNFKVEEQMYKFSPEKLPASRNVFYQICDIEDEDVQNLIKNEDNPMSICSEKDGWCTSNIQDKCRDIMSKKHEFLVKNQSNEGHNREEKNSKK